MVDQTYQGVVDKIGTNTVSIGDFNQLLSEALAKSASERVHRHVRVDNPQPGGVSLAGRVVPKRAGIDDPPRQGRGKRFAAGKPAKERQNQKQQEAHMEARET